MGGDVPLPAAGVRGAKREVLRLVERVEAFEEGPGKFRTFVSHVGGRG